MSRPIEVLAYDVMDLTVTRTDYGTVRIVQSWAGNKSNPWSDGAESPAELEQHIEIFTEDLAVLIAALKELKAAPNDR